MAKSHATSSFTSHEAFSHDSIDHLGFDWERVAFPEIAPRYPFKVYLPESTEDVVRAVRECTQLGQTLKIRSKGHSSNDLVLADRGNVLCIEKLNRIIAFDPGQHTVTVASGVVLAELDQFLGGHGFGLPIIGDHNHITAGGFASVGGISPASHRFGMFVDTVRSLEFVNWAGDVVRASRTERSEDFYRVLAGTGQHGVLTTLTLDVIRIDKDRQIVANERELYTELTQFVLGSHRRISDPGEALLERGVWLDYPVGGRSIRVGQFSTYRETAPAPLKSLANRLAYGYLHGLGRWAGQLPTQIDVAVKLLGMLGVMLSPRYASVRNVETFTDRVMDSSVGDPTRMFIVLAPVERYPKLFLRLHELFLKFRTETGCFSFVSVYVKAIRSPYLSASAPAGLTSDLYSELMFYCGIDPARMTAARTEALVSALDDICIEEGAFRYMHSRTVKDAERRSQIDPNARFREAAQPEQSKPRQLGASA